MKRKTFITSVCSLGRNQKIRQVAALYTSMVLGVLISLAVSMVNTRALGPQHFGELKFLQNLFAFTLTCVTFGIFVSGGRLLAKEENAEARRYLTSALVVFVGALTVVLMIFFWFFSFAQENVFDNELGGLIRLSLPLLFVYPLQLCLENTFKGSNRIYSLSFLRVAPGLLYLPVASYLYFNGKLDLTLALLLYLTSIAAVAVFSLVRIRPAMHSVRVSVGHILTEVREYGIHVYSGILAGVATTQLGGIAVAYFIDNVAVGYFILARTITMPLTMLCASVGATFFRSFAQSDAIPGSVLYSTLAIAGLALVAFLLILEPVVSFLYTEEFIAIVPLAGIMAFGAVFHGLGDVINNFICAQGFGKYARNAAILRGVCNCLGFTGLVYWFGVYGAAITVLLAGVVFLGALVFFYIRTQRPNVPEQQRVVGECDSG